MNARKYFFYLLSVLIITQNVSFGQSNTIVRDLNKDRSFDFLVMGMEWQDIDLWDYVLTDGRTGRRWGYASNIDYFGAQSIISIGKTRNEMGADWDPVIRMIEDTLLNFMTEPDPSLEWVLNACIIKLDVEQAGMFDRVIGFEKKWYPGEPFISENYTYRLRDDQSFDIYEAEIGEAYYWHYRSHNHRDDKQGLEPFDVGGRKFYKTKHALIASDQGRYSWIFMSGVNQTSGPSKLRWPSIGKVEILGDLLILQQSVVVGEYSFWVCDLQRDIWARLRIDDMDIRTDFSIQNGKLILLDGEGKAGPALPMEKIEREIRQY